MSFYCQAERRDGTLCPHTSSNVRNTTAGPVAVCGHHVRSRTVRWGRQFDPECLWPEGLAAAAEMYDQQTQKHLGLVEFHAERAASYAAKAAECLIRADWERERSQSET